VGVVGHISASAGGSLWSSKVTTPSEVALNRVIQANTQQMMRLNEQLQRGEIVYKQYQEREKELRQELINNMQNIPGLG